jgi:Uncharacterized protein conserved in bacteria C-term(DUF2220)
MNKLIEEQTIEIIKRLSRKTDTGKRKKINTDNLEKMVKKDIGGLEQYRNSGGYSLFVASLEKLVSEGKLTEMVTSKLNKRVPPIKECFWLKGVKDVEKIDVEKFFFQLGDLINFNFYKENKSLLTRQECLKITRIYQFLKNNNENKATILLREERSLMLFYDMDTGGIEPEKYLSSSKGKTLLSRLGLDLQDLNCMAMKEPYKYWKNPNEEFNNINEILIVEGLATYHSFKKMLQEDKWDFGVKPQLLIFGSGKRILSSFEYTEELFELRKDMNIRYFGDLDPEGYSIYCQLKERYEDYNINLDEECYRFMYTNTCHFAVRIQTDQLMVKKHLLQITQELERNIPGIKDFLMELWVNKKRIAQETMNLFTIEIGRGE